MLKQLFFHLLTCDQIVRKETIKFVNKKILHPDFQVGVAECRQSFQRNNLRPFETILELSDYWTISN